MDLQWCLLYNSVYCKLKCRKCTTAGGDLNFTRYLVSFGVYLNNTANSRGNIISIKSIGRIKISNLSLFGRGGVEYFSAVETASVELNAVIVKRNVNAAAIKGNGGTISYTRGTFIEFVLNSLEKYLRKPDFRAKCKKIGSR